MKNYINLININIRSNRNNKIFINKFKTMEAKNNKFKTIETKNYINLVNKINRITRNKT